MSRQSLPMRLLAGTVRAIVPLAVLVIAVLAGIRLTASRPAPESQEREEIVIPVETVLPQLTSARAVVSAFGIVSARKRLTLQPQVGGPTVEVGANVEIGGLVGKGDLLFRIDERDFELAVAQRAAEVETAKFNLEVERGRSAVAVREYGLLEDSLPGTVNERLARREAHVAEREAALAAAESRLAAANLDLERTTVRAPFAALVESEDLEIGQMMTTGSRAITLIGTDACDVEVSVPLDRLEWLRFESTSPGGGSPVRVHVDLSSGRSAVHEGRVERLTGQVDPAGRMARVIVGVTDPFCLRAEGDVPTSPLLLGATVRVEIEGPQVDDVIELPRSVVQENSRVWVMDSDGRLASRTIEVVVGRPDSVLARAAFQPGDEIILSPMPVPIPGQRLRRVGDAPVIADAERGS